MFFSVDGNAPILRPFPAVKGNIMMSFFKGPGGRCRVLALAIASAIATTATSASATTVNVLWYNYSDGPYQASINTLAASAPTFGSGISWNVTYWNAGSAAPTLSGFNVLVIESPEFGGPNYTSIFNAQSAITSARGDRTFISGQDADWHYINGPGPINNGPKGFLIDAIDWAASGTGLGIVELDPARAGLDSNPNSFLFSELNGHTSIDDANDVNIPAAYASLPINAGLTSAGLTGWNNSYHSIFTTPVAGYTAINVNNAGQGVTLISTAALGGDTTPAPLPSYAGMGTTLFVGFGIAFLATRKRVKVA